MVDPLTPDDIARRTFDVARRGYEQHEVRGFLHEVSSNLERLSREIVELRERAERAEAKLQMADRPDEAMLLEVLGEETTRVLTSARDSAAEIRSKAEEAAARIIDEATSAAAETRSSATRDADGTLASARAESDSILEAARTELERRSAEAEEAAAAIRAAGEADAARMRADVEAELAQSRADAEAAREAGRQEGRHMVAEAQIVRERILRDLAARRKKIRQQVEKLNAGRERLLEAYETVRNTLDDANRELSTSVVEARHAADTAARQVAEEPEDTLEDLEAEVAAANVTVPEERLTGDDTDAADPDDPAGDDASEADSAGSTVDAEGEEPGPFSGEVPAVPSEPRTIEVGDAGRGRRRRKKGVALPPVELTVLEAPSESEGVRVLAQPAVEEPAAAEVETGPDAPATPADDAPAADEAAPVEDAPPSEVASDEPSGDAAEDQSSDDETGAEDAPVELTVVDGSESADVDAGEETPAAEGEEPQKAESVFARLRAEASAGPEEPATDEAPAVEAPVAEAVEPEAAEPAADTAEPEPEADATDRAAFVARSEACEPVGKELAKQLKRLLADEQNEVLDLLRRTKPKGVDDVLPAADEHAARWADAVSEILGRAATSGAELSGAKRHKAASVADLADELARNLSDPLRDRIDRSFAASDGNLDDVSDRVRALYREWKGKRLTEATSHFVAAAYARGVFDGIDTGSQVRWVVDPSAGACPDCDDNVLGGAIAKGDEFPTGNDCAPAHPGCHCLVLPAG